MGNAARLIGPGRAGGSLAGALRQCGWSVDVLGRGNDVANAAADVDLVVLAVPDDAIDAVAAGIRPQPQAVVIHLSGSRGLDVLAPHRRVGSLHPLASLPDAATGTRRLLDGATFAVAGDPIVGHLVEQFGGRAIEVADEQRPLYHATAAVAANHVVALLAQVERLAHAAGVPADAYWPMVRTSVDNAVRLGATAALTGPAARGDADTIRAHVRALPHEERDLYVTLAAEAARLAGRTLPELCQERAS